jgi:cytochrome c
MMPRSWSALLLALAVANSPASAEAVAGDVEAGAKAFVPCSACHSVAPGGAALIGPNLNGVVGRAVGGSPAFDYSAELKAVGGTWTPEQLDRFLTNPSVFAPGTRMGYAGVTDLAERRALIAYLSSLRADSGAAVGAAAVDFGPGWPAGPGQAETGELCNSCHSLAIVKQQRLSRETWDTLLTWMVEKQGMAVQTPERRALMLEYLVQHFGQP